MHIELHTDGGFAAIPGLSRPVVLDDVAASAADSGTLNALVDAALEEQRRMPAALPRRVPDARSYRLSIERNGRHDLLSAQDAQVPPAFKALMQFVKQHGHR